VRADARGALGLVGALVFVDEAAQDIHAFDRLTLPALCEVVSFDWCALWGSRTVSLALTCSVLEWLVIVMLPARTR
jgi:hypothetical protein